MFWNESYRSEDDNNILSNEWFITGSESLKCNGPVEILTSFRVENELNGFSGILSDSRSVMWDFGES